MYAVWSTIADALIVTDATADEIVEYFGDEARKAAEEEARAQLEAIREQEADDLEEGRSQWAPSC
jgi:hypothetical protein